MNYYLTIYCITIVSMLVLHFLLMRRILAKLKQFKEYKDETDHKLDVLIRVSHTHEQFIDSVKKRTEELAIRNRKGGIR